MTGVQTCALPILWYHTTLRTFSYTIKKLASIYLIHRDEDISKIIHAVPLLFMKNHALTRYIKNQYPALITVGFRPNLLWQIQIYDKSYINRIYRFNRMLKGEFTVSLLLLRINQQLSVFRLTVTIPHHCISANTITQFFFLVKLKILFCTF